MRAKFGEEEVTNMLHDIPDNNPSYRSLDATMCIHSSDFAKNSLRVMLTLT